jgi:hypothetical protein
LKRKEKKRKGVSVGISTQEKVLHVGLKVNIQKKKKNKKKKVERNDKERKSQGKV